MANLAERPAVLPLHPGRLRALLREAGVVERQDARADRHDGAQLRPDARGVPRRVRDEVLQRLIVARVAQAAVHRLHRFPLAVVEQPIDCTAWRRPAAAVDSSTR